MNALVRKSWTYQRKNISMNVCVLMAPIVVAILLASMQTLLDDATAEDQFDRVLTCSNLPTFYAEISLCR